MINWWLNWQCFYHYNIDNVASVKTQINDKSNYKRHRLKLGLFTSNLWNEINRTQWNIQRMSKINRLHDWLVHGWSLVKSHTVNQRSSRFWFMILVHEFHWKSSLLEGRRYRSLAIGDNAKILSKWVEGICEKPGINTTWGTQLNIQWK